MIKVLPKMPPNVALVDAESMLPRFRRERDLHGAHLLLGGLVCQVFTLCVWSVSDRRQCHSTSST